MSYVAPEIFGLAFFMLTGWASLWPARRTLGPAAYHLAAIPTGLLASAIAAAVATLAGRPLDVASAGVGALLFAVAMQLLLRRLGRTDRATSPVAPWTFAAAAGVAGALGTAFGLARLTVINSDSVMSYWPLGVELARKGVFSPPLLGTRSVLLPAMDAVFHSFGSDWAYVVYPMLAVTLLGWLAATLLSGPLAGIRRRSAWGIVGVAMLALVIEPSFLFHSVFVHSHMISAVYLLMSLTCLWYAARPGTGNDPDDSDPTYLVLAGTFAAGLALARPDGLAYAFVPIVAAIAVLTRAKVDPRRVAAFFGPPFLILLAVYGAAYVEMGFWVSGKLSGKKTILVLAVLACSALGPWIVSWLDRRLPFRVSGERFFGLAVPGAAVLMLVAFALKWGTAREALANAWLNLLAGSGGYNYLWWGVIALLLISVLTHDALRRGSWTRSPFLSVLLFFIIAGVVHGVSHEGRVGAGDSLNRVSFHALPIVVWYLAAIVARILGDSSTGKTAAD